MESSAALQMRCVVDLRGEFVSKLEQPSKITQLAKS